MDPTFETIPNNKCALDNIRSSEVEISKEERKRIEQEKLQYNVTDRPPFFLMISLALQNILPALTSVMGVSAILSDVLCMEPNDPIRVRIFSTILLLSGLGTVLQSNFGVRLPIFQAPAYAFVPPLLALNKLDDWKCDKASTPDASNETQLFNASQVTAENSLELKYEKLQLLSGSLILASFIEFLAGASGFTGHFQRFISPITVSVSIASIGFSVIDFTMEYCQRSWSTSMVTACCSFIFMLYLNNMDIRLLPFSKKGPKSKIFRSYPILLAVCLGWALSYILTIYGHFPDDPETKEFLARTDAKEKMINSTPWIIIPYPGQYGYPKFHVPTFIGFTIAVICSIIESVGDYFAAGNICQTGRPPNHAINRGIMSEGFTGIVSGLMGAANATTSYSSHIALIGITKVASRIVLTVAGLMTIALAMVGKLAAVLAAIPDPIIGATFLIGVATLISLGISTLHNIQFNTRNTLIFGTALAFGLMLPKWIAETPNAINTGNFDVDQSIKVVLGTPIFVSSVLASFLDNTVPGTAKERGMAQPKNFADNAFPGHQNASYNDIYEFPIIRNFLKKHQNITNHIPFLPSYSEELLTKGEMAPLKEATLNSSS